MQETQGTWVQSLSQEDPLEEEMATHSRISARKISWTEEPGRLQSMGLQRVRQNLATEHYLSIYHSLFLYIWLSVWSLKFECACMYTQRSVVFKSLPLKGCSSQGSSVHGIFQTRILEYVAFSHSRGSSQLRDWTHMSSMFVIGRWNLLHSSSLTF